MLLLRLKSNMDRFIETLKDNITTDDISLKSNMDRFIGFLKMNMQKNIYKFKIQYG